MQVYAEYESWLDRLGNNSIYPFIHLFICSSTYPSIHSYIHLCTYLSISPLVHPSICSSLYSLLHWFIHPFVHHSICSSLYSLLHWFIHSSIHPSRDYFSIVAKGVDPLLDNTPVNLHHIYSSCWKERWSTIKPIMAFGSMCES